MKELLDIKRELEDRYERVKNNSLKLNEKEALLNSLTVEKEELKSKIEELAKENIKFEEEVKNLTNSKKELEIGIELKKKRVMELEIEKMKLLNDIETSSRRIKGSNSKVTNLKAELESYDSKLNLILKDIEKAGNDKDSKEKN